MAKKTTKKTTKKTARKPAKAIAKVSKKAAKKTAKKASTKKPGKSGKAEPRLLSGGNPQIAKGEGDTPVHAYIAAMPGWKRGVGERLDALIEAAAPGVCRAVKWNSPLYAMENPDGKGGERGWFLGMHCFTGYIKIAFFRGASLDPVPPDASKQKEVRYLNIREGWGGPEDEAGFTDWVRQASRMPGERM